MTPEGWEQGNSENLGYVYVLSHEYVLSIVGFTYTADFIHENLNKYMNTSV